MTANEVIAHVRRLLNDDVEGMYRWPKATLIQYLNLAIRRLYTKRPDLKLQSDFTIDEDDAVVNGTETLLMDVVYLDALAMSVAASALREDNMDAANLQVAQRYDENFDWMATL